MWEFNPAYRCSLVDTRGHFKGLVDEAMRSVGKLSLTARLSCFDADDRVVDDVSESADTEASFKTSDSFDCLNVILCSFKEIAGRLDSMERPGMRRILDREFLRSCQETISMIDEELYSCSLDNHVGTAALHLTWENDSTMDNVSTILSETLDSVSTEEEQGDINGKGGDENESSGDDLSDSSDTVAWKREIYQSAFDEYDFDIVDYRGRQIEVIFCTYNVTCKSYILCSMGVTYHQLRVL